MRRLWMSGVAAVMAISMAGLSAQNPPQNPPPTQPPTTTPPATPAEAQAAAVAQNTMTTTIQGCVYKEEAVAGRTPNVAEKAGVLEDYILVASADTSAGTVGTTGTTPPAAGATPAPKAFKLEKISDDKLKTVVGKRVEVTGKMISSAAIRRAQRRRAPPRPTRASARMRSNCRSSKWSRFAKSKGPVPQRRRFASKSTRGAGSGCAFRHPEPRAPSP